MGALMRTYYFDIRDKAAVLRDKVGIQFPTAADAIKHGNDLARRLRDDPRSKAPDLLIIIIDESGTEVHRESVHLQCSV